MERGMTLSITHRFSSPKADGTDPTIVQPTNWNDTHELDGLLGLDSGGTGAGTAADARTSLGLGTAAVQNVAAFLQPANNLSDVADDATAVANIGAAYTVPTAAALLALTTRPPIVFMKGYTTPNDGYAGSFIWYAGSTETADNLNIFSPTSGEAGRYIRQANGIIKFLTTGGSIYQGLSSAGIDGYQADAQWGAGASANRIFSLSYILNPDTTATRFAGVDYAYAAKDDDHLVLYRMGYVGISTLNTMRHPLNSTTNSLDIGPTLALIRATPNPAVGSNCGSVGFPAVGSMVYATLTTTNPFAVVDTTPTVTVTDTNHGKLVGETVYFPTAITGRGISFGGPSDTASNNGNVKGTYYIQTVPNANSYTITAAMNATSTGTMGGASVAVNRQAYQKTMSSNPFVTTLGSKIVTVTHVNHQLAAATGTNPANPRALASNPSHAFYEGSSAVGGATIVGPHPIQTIVDADHYTIFLDVLSDGVAVATSGATGGGTPTFSYSETNENLNVAAFHTVIQNGDINNPSGLIQVMLGSVPNHDAGNAAEINLSKQGHYAGGLEPLDPPGPGILHFHGLRATSRANTDLVTALDTTTAAQHNYIVLSRGGTPKTRIWDDTANLFRLRDVVNSVDFLSYSHTDANMSIGYGGGTITVKGAINYAGDSGSTDDYVITLNPTPSAYFAGMEILFAANTANTGAATINVNGLGAKTIVKGVNTALANNDILAGMFCKLAYDGTNFVLMSRGAL
jgi:hypothetical protein